MKGLCKARLKTHGCLSIEKHTVEQQFQGDSEMLAHMLIIGHQW